MNKRGLMCDAVTRDTCRLTVLSLILQAMGLAFNVKLSESAGTAAVGIMSLIFSFFGCIMVLANGNIFVSTSRFVSEENEGGGNILRIMKWSLTFSVLLSGGFGAVSFFSADILANRFFKSAQLGLAVKILAFSLTPAAAGSCIKGYFHGLRRIKVPMRGDTAEFIFKWLCMGMLLIAPYNIDFYVITAISICAGEIFSCVYYLAKFVSSIRNDKLSASESSVIPNGKIYMKMNIPIVVSGYVQMIMSAANEAIVPAALLRYSSSADAALSQYGMFEAMIIPAVFFPAVAMGSMSNIMIPESAAAMKAGGGRPAALVHDSFLKAFSFSIFIAGFFLCFGKELGAVICPSDGLVGRSLVILAPVIPFIYLEIILEGMLKGMGRQNFCTVNSLAEYIIRIGCVLIFVPKVGFYGVIISYYASNCVSNIARLITVCRTAEAGFSVTEYILLPGLKSGLCCLAAAAVGVVLHGNYPILSLTAKAAAACLTYFLIRGAGKGTEAAAAVTDA